MIEIEGAKTLAGTIRAAGAKNAALPAIIASLSTQEPVVIQGVPRLLDVDTALSLVHALGKEVEVRGHEIRLTGGQTIAPVAPADLVRRMRASFLALGPMLARGGTAWVPLPGGCAIGARPVDLHLRGLAALGAEIRIHAGSVHARAPRLRGTTVYLDYPSVGATEQLLLAGALAQGETVVLNPAREPEVMDLSQLLTAMGAEVQWSPDRVVIQGRRELGGATHSLIPDRIEAGTYLLAGVLCQGAVRVEGVRPDHFGALLQKLREAGVEVEWGEDWTSLSAHGRPRAVDVETRPYPGFPTDLQPPMVALLSLAQGKAVVTETVFEGRFGHVPELIRMGARLRLWGRALVVEGVPALQGAPVSAMDIRAGAALLLAALAAQGRTELMGEEHLRRGYEDLLGKLRELGANIWERTEASS